MKKMSKRFFTLVMALVMALSCTAFASAAEVSAEESAVATATAVQPRAAGNLGVPFTSKDTVATGRNYVEGSFYLDHSAYIKLSLANYDACTLEILSQSSGAWSRIVNISASQNAKTYTIWSNKAPAGNYYFKIRFPSSNSIFAGQFLWTDSLY